MKHLLPKCLLRQIILIGVQALICGTGTATADESGIGQEESGIRQVDFASEVLPILQRRCLECHGPDAREGGFRLTSRDDLLLRNDSGEPSIVSGKSRASELVRRIRSGDEDRMPPEGDRLTDEQIRMIEQWIDAGAEWNVESSPSPVHWAYVAPQKADIPSDVHPVDHFVSKTLAVHAAGLQPSPAEL
ncbi:MAG: c-type cytochrome, partial [Planctomycetaceae bacterium]|nr:c-type cytochrome [Planctomycetaceae bacterium]